MYDTSKSVVYIPDVPVVDFNLLMLLTRNWFWDSDFHFILVEVEWRTDKQISNDLSIYQTHKNQMSDFSDQMSQGKTIINQRSPCWSSLRYSPRVVRLVVIHLSEYRSYHSYAISSGRGHLKERPAHLPRWSHKY